jgi:hypothetical protein
MKHGDQSKVRERLIAEKDFFEHLHTCRTPLEVRHLLNISSKNQLHLLARVIHFVASGEIPLKKEKYERIKRSKKLTFINNEFEREKDIAKLLSFKRRDLITTLYKIQGVIPDLVSPLVSNNG